MAKNYNADSISILEGLEAVRKRPGMYIGSTSARGLHHLVWEILDNAIDEAIIGECDSIKVTLFEDMTIEIKDNGRGMPVDLHKEKKLPAERVIFTILHAGGKFDKNSYAFSGGLHGVGASVVNALSEWLEVTIVDSNGNVYFDKYENGGKPVVKLEKDNTLKSIKKVKKSLRGTTVKFKPDAEIFDTIKFNSETINKRLKELAYLNPNLKIEFNDKINQESMAYHETNGIAGLVEEIVDGTRTIHSKPIIFNGEVSGIKVNVAFQFVKEYGEVNIAFTNNINNVEGGTHVTGFKAAFTRLINNYAKELGYIKAKEQNFSGNDVRNGLRMVISVYHPDPQFEGQTKTKLGNNDTKQAVDEIVTFELTQFFDRNVEILEKIIKNAKVAFENRKVDDKKKKNFMNETTSKFETSKKLAACENKTNNGTEIYIVEGDSAGGSAKTGRNRKFQAVLPLRGKILNVEKVQLSKVISSETIQTIINALGCGFNEEFDIKKLRYEKVIIMTDADVDGAHIMVLLLTFFFRMMPQLIHAGKIFVAMPPLYKFVHRNKVFYLYSDKELNDIKKGKTNYTIQRYKGLGEMDAKQLWNTTMNPETRFLKQVKSEDMVEMEEITNLLMGTKVPPRRSFIEKESRYAELDF